MRFLTLHWWELSAYLFGFSSIIINALWLLTTLKEKPRPSGGPESMPISQTLNSGPMPEIPRKEKRDKRTVWISSLMLAALAGIGAGYAIHSSFQRHARTQSDGNFHSRPQIHWKIIREYPAANNRIGYDIELPGGDITRNVIPCEYRGLHTGMMITSAGFRDMGDCLSFQEPGWMKIEYENQASENEEQYGGQQR